MLRCDGSSDVRAAVQYEFHSLLRCDVLHDDLELGKIGMEGLQYGLDESSFSIKDIDRRVCCLAMDTQWHSQLCHFSLLVKKLHYHYEYAVDIMDIGNTVVAVRCSSSRVILTSIHDSTLFGQFNFLRRCVIREISS